MKQGWCQDYAQLMWWYWIPQLWEQELDISSASGPWCTLVCLDTGVMGGPSAVSHGSRKSTQLAGHSLAVCEGLLFIHGQGKGLPGLLSKCHAPRLNRHGDTNLKEQILAPSHLGCIIPKPLEETFLKPVPEPHEKGQPLP